MRETGYSRNEAMRSSNCSRRSSSNRRRRSKSYNYHRLYAVILTMVMIICGSVVLFNKSVSSASDEPVLEMRYTSIEIQTGDTLWSIASEYYTEDWKDIETYMEKIKEFNGLENNVIHAGNYLSVPYTIEVE